MMSSLFNLAYPSIIRLTVGFKWVPGGLMRGSVWQVTIPPRPVGSCLTTALTRLAVLSGWAMNAFA